LPPQPTIVNASAAASTAAANFLNSFIVSSLPQPAMDLPGQLLQAASCKYTVPVLGHP
jgi:hypothetical protein